MRRKGYYDQYHWTDKINIKKLMQKPQTVAFILTFAIVLAIGVPALFIVKGYKQTGSLQRSPFASKWEAIPEAGIAMNAAVTSEEAAHKAAVIFEGDEDYTHVIGAAEDCTPKAREVRYSPAEALFALRHETLIAHRIFDRVRSKLLRLGNNTFHN